MNDEQSRAQTKLFNMSGSVSVSVSAYSKDGSFIVGFVEGIDYAEAVARVEKTLGDTPHECLDYSEEDDTKVKLAVGVPNL